MPDTQRPTIRTAAVLGAGVMGAQIAAVLANAGIKTWLFDLPAKHTDPHYAVKQAVQRLHQLKPAPLVVPEAAALIQAASYEHDLAHIAECDLIIEAIAERIDFKKALFGKIAPHIHARAILASNTSGLSINELARYMSPKLRTRFCGIHFFNPPRYMRLIELVASESTDAAIIEQLENFLVSRLGKGVLHAKDTPNFIANRVGVFSMLSIMHHAQRLAVPLEVVDALTGPLLGRPKSATLRTADVVGLDTMGYVIHTMAEHLTIDPWAKFYVLPAWIQTLVDAQALGQKTQGGIYKKVGQTIQVWDIAAQQYRVADKQPGTTVQQIMQLKDSGERFAALYASHDNEAQLLWSHFRDLFHYCVVHGQSIAHSLRDVDLALRWGFGWREGPFATWQLAGWQAIIAYLQADIAAGKAMAEQHVPQWATDKNFAGVYTAEGAYVPETRTYQPRSSLAVYKRQLYPETLLAEESTPGITLFENASMRFWHMGDDIGIVSFNTKMNTINSEVLDGISTAITYAEQHCRGLVLWQQRGEHFSLGADLGLFATAVQQGDLAQIDNVLAKFQRTVLQLRYASVPTIAAVKGMVLGGGCELMLHCARIVAASETYVGLVEAGVGLLPAGGGTKECALRAASEAGSHALLPYLQHFYLQVAKAEVSSSAADAQARRWLAKSDIVVANPYEILYVAKQTVAYLDDVGYQAPVPRTWRVAGKAGLATLQTGLLNMREGGFISAYDYELASKIAYVMCGGAVEANSIVDEAWLLRLEREVFLELAVHENTQARIAHTLKTGKPLRN